MRKNRGLGYVVAAAFIGPGTITTCMVAGFKFDYDLVWALVFSLIATLVLQEMSLRLGVVTGSGLAANLSRMKLSPQISKPVLGFVLFAIVLGNTAYQAGNISGAVLGLQGFIPFQDFATYPIIIGLLSFYLLWTGNGQKLQILFMILIAIMGLCFVSSAILVCPPGLDILKSIFQWQLTAEKLPTVLALIGTTVVPYNLFLHAGLSQAMADSKKALTQARLDSTIAIIIGGIISLCIIIVGSAIDAESVSSAKDLAIGIQPVFGDYAQIVMGLGLFLAGLTSAITAPLAAAIVAREVFGWPPSFSDSRFRAVWIFVLGFGLVVLGFDISLLQIIELAQVFNGILLPLISILLLVLVNQKAMMRSHKNGWVQNLIGLAVIVFSIFLGFKGMAALLGLI